MTAEPTLPFRYLKKEPNEQYTLYQECDLKKKKLSDLKEILKELQRKVDGKKSELKRKLGITGKKTVLIDRIIKFQRNEDNFLSDYEQDYEHDDYIRSINDKNEILLIFGYVSKLKLSAPIPFVLVILINKYIGEYETLYIDVNKSMSLDVNIKQHIFSNIFIKNHGKLNPTNSSSNKLPLNILVYNDIIMNYKSEIDLKGYGMSGVWYMNGRFERYKPYITDINDADYYKQFGSGGDAGSGNRKQKIGGGCGGNGGGALCLTVLGNIYMSKGSKINANGTKGEKNGSGGDGGSIDIKCYGKIKMHSDSEITAIGGKKGGMSLSNWYNRHNYNRNNNGLDGRIRIKCDSKSELNVIQNRIKPYPDMDI